MSVLPAEKRASGRYKEIRVPGRPGSRRFVWIGDKEAPLDERLFTTSAIELRRRERKLARKGSGLGRAKRDLARAKARRELVKAKAQLTAARAATLPPHNPARRYTYAQIQELGKEGLAYKKVNGTYSFPVVDKEDLTNAVHAIGRAPKDETLAVKRWLIISADRVNAWGLIPEGWHDEVKAASPHGIPR